MKCETVWPLLSAYADGEATTAETAIVEAHVAVCTDCARDLAFMKSATGILRDTPVLDPPARVRQAILAATIERPRWRRRVAEVLQAALRPAAVRYGLAAAGAAVLTLVVMRRTAGPVAVPHADAPGSRRTANLLVPERPVRMPHGEPGFRIAHTAPTTVEKPRTGPRRAVAIAAGSAPAGWRAKLRSVAALHRARKAPLAAVAARFVTTFRTTRGPAPSGALDKVPQLADNRPEETSPATTPMDSMTSSAGVPKPDTSLPVAAAVSTAHIQLASDVTPASTHQMVSLADLKHWLRRNNDAGTRLVEANIRDRQIRLELYRGRF